MMPSALVSLLAAIVPAGSVHVAIGAHSEAPSLNDVAQVASVAEALGVPLHSFFQVLKRTVWHLAELCFSVQVMCTKLLQVSRLRLVKQWPLSLPNFERVWWASLVGHVTSTLISGRFD